nr:hypothetical protein CFP56_66488 [Quercus suber]
MNYLRSLLGYKDPPVSSAPVEGDDVYPAHALDGTIQNRKFVTWLLQFNDVLNADKLHHSLSELLEIGDWRKLGGRLRRTPNDRLEIHVPSPFSKERPAVGFYHENLQTVKINEHPLAQHLPKKTTGPSVQPASIDLKPLIAPPEMPLTVAMTIDAIVDQDLPQIWVRVTTFADATLVAFSWPHTLMDAGGVQALFQNWSLVLAGKKVEVATVLGAREDVLLQAAKDDDAGANEELLIDKRRLTGLNLVKWIGGYLWDSYWNPPLEVHAIFLPKKAFASLQNRVQRELAEDAADGKASFVSESDVLMAWMTRLAALAEPRPRPLTIATAFNIRSRLPSLGRSTGVYLQNMILAVYTFLPAALGQGPVGPIAAANRTSIVGQTTTAQTTSLLRSVQRDIAAKNSASFLFGDATAIPMLYNNLTQLKVIQAVDFSAAVIRRGESDKSRSNPLGTMVNFHTPKERQGLRFLWVLGKDHVGDYWLMASLLPKTWELMRDELENEGSWSM